MVQLSNTLLCQLKVKIQFAILGLTDGSQNGHFRVRTSVVAKRNSSILIALRQRFVKSLKILFMYDCSCWVAESVTETEHGSLSSTENWIDVGIRKTDNQIEKKTKNRLCMLWLQPSNIRCFFHNIRLTMKMPLRDHSCPFLTISVIVKLFAP